MWYREYLGRPWVEYATGPDAFDCWGWVVFALQKHFGVNDVPRCGHVKSGDHRGYTAAAHKLQQTGSWKKLQGPQEGAVVLMGRCKKGVPIVQHIGIVVGGRIAHCRINAGVCVEPVSTLENFGYTVFDYWKHISL